MSEQDLQRDFGRLEGKVDAIVSGVGEVKDALKDLARNEQTARKSLEEALNTRIEDLETRHKRLERLSYVLHGVWIAIVGLFTLPASVKNAVAALLKTS